MKNKNHVWVWFYPKQPKKILSADIYNSNCWQSVLATVKIHVNRVGVFYPFFSNDLSDTEIITSANKSQPMLMNIWKKEKGWLFWKLTFYSDFIQTQQIFAPKNVICAKNATTNIRFFDVYRLTSNMFTIRTGNLFAILYTCWNKLRFKV